MKKTFFFWVYFCCASLLFAQQSALSETQEAEILSSEVRTAIGNYLTNEARKEISVGKIHVDSVAIDNKKLFLFANINCSYIPFREDLLAHLYKGIAELLPTEYVGYTLQLFTDNHRVEEFIPQALHQDKRKKQRPLKFTAAKPLVTPLSAPYSPDKGLKNNHIALWQSHGYYYEQKLGRWEWQRARIFQTVEDLYTQSYVLPFLVDMLENAGANVLIPRERDVQMHEVIVDNDGCLDASAYSESDGDHKWQAGTGVGFAHLRPIYKDNENPFREGSYRMAKTIKKGKESMVEWKPNIPEQGRYAVYVSYQTLPESTSDAIYTVHHAGGTSRFAVNQQMGGGTWIYLGHFTFNQGLNDANKVTLSNKSSKNGRIVTADAVKIGGGYGNIARTVYRTDDTDINKTNQPIIDYPLETSRYPRFTEGARYWLQWAGIPDSIYSESKGMNDYTDDYKCRGLWVNYLAGGSSSNPDEKGLNIPIDMAFAFHSDAGTTLNDSIIGTLGIFFTETEDGIYPNGRSRYVSRELTDLVQSQIVEDVRTLYEPNWTRRGMWNKSYYEARVPRVPTMLLELLSHQNFADMRYGLDPRFRFTVSRAIYKAMLRFVSNQYGRQYVVQPLPVDHFSVEFVGDAEVALSWLPVDDPLEPTAKAQRYVVYTRVGDADFDNGVVVNEPTYRMVVKAGTIYSYKVTALNDGGESFPSEILSIGKAVNEKGRVLVVNGFDRVSAPADFVSEGIAGFCDDIDHGVPYLYDISYIGSMKEFRRSIPWMDDDASGFGDSYGNYETKVIAGNTFDYPADHGRAILNAGYSFASCSNEAVEDQCIDLKPYHAIDLILGKQRQVKMGRGGVVPTQFKTFSQPLQEAITAYCQSGGNVFVSGAFVGSDLWDNPGATSEDRAFASEVLHYKWMVNRAAAEGRVRTTASPFTAFGGEYSFCNTLNDKMYVVEAPDGIVPTSDDAFTIFRYAENNIGAGVAYKGHYSTCILGFPFEAINSPQEKEELMSAILRFFESK